MNVRGSLFPLFREGRRIFFYSLAAVSMALPLHADIVSVSGFGVFEEAAYGNVDFTVNPDGSVTVNNSFSTPLPTSYSFDFTEGSFGPAGGVDPVYLHALPPGSTINSATINFSVGTGVDASFPGDFEVGAGVQGNPTITSVSLLAYDSGVPVSPCAGVCTWTSPFAASYPITLNSTLLDGETLLDLNVAAADSGQITYNALGLDPGEYDAGVNLTMNESYTITVDYSTTPEPRMTVLIALAVIALIAIRARNRQHPTRATHI